MALYEEAQGFMISTTYLSENKSVRMNTQTDTDRSEDKSEAHLDPIGCSSSVFSRLSKRC